MYDDGIVGGMCNSRGKLEVNSVTATDEKQTNKLQGAM
jgi:hypothetical protein